MSLGNLRIERHPAILVYFAAFRNNPLKKVEIVIFFITFNPGYYPNGGPLVMTVGTIRWRKKLYNNIILRVKQ